PAPPQTAAPARPPAALPGARGHRTRPPGLARDPRGLPRAKAPADPAPQPPTTADHYRGALPATGHRRGLGALPRHRAPRRRLGTGPAARLAPGSTADRGDGTP